MPSLKFRLCSVQKRASLLTRTEPVNSHIQAQQVGYFDVTRLVRSLEGRATEASRWAWDLTVTAPRHTALQRIPHLLRIRVFPRN